MALTYEEIFEYNRNWINERLTEDPEFFSKMSIEQKPEYLFIGCSDSRADPEEFTGFGLGDAFVHRNVSNIVNPIDLNVASVIQYAIENLKIKQIIVCGHYGCGGVSAAMRHQGLGKNSPWLQIIRDIYRIHQRELDSIKSEEKRYDRLVELNVIEQSQNVYKMDCVQERLNTPDQPKVHGWVFDMRTGTIIDLKVNQENGEKESKGILGKLKTGLSSLFKLKK